MRKTVAVAAVMFVGLLSAEANAIDQRADFEITFLANNFGAIRLWEAKPIQAGSLLSARRYDLLDSLQECVEDWAGRYRRPDTPFSFTTISKSRSGKIEGSVKSLFSLEGDLDVKVSSNVDDGGGLGLKSDFVRIERFRVDEVLKSGPECGIYRDLYAHRYLSKEYVVVDRAFFLSGNVTHSYSLSFSGNGRGSISSDRIGDFLRRIPFLKDIGDLFKFDAELRVGGSSLSSEATRFAYGKDNELAIGFLPVAFQRPLAEQLVSRIAELPKGVNSLIEAAEDGKSADEFLGKNKDLDVRNLESYVALVFRGEDLEFYEEFRKKDPDFSSTFAEILSRILQLNKLAGRFDAS